jgi:transglutaminase-like putative cysteine protease
MQSVKIQHTTIYHYQQPVTFGPHRLLLRPPEARDLRLVSYDIQIRPMGSISWAQDVSGNMIARVDIPVEADNLTFYSTAEVEVGAARWPIFDIAVSAASYPFRYTENEWTDLGALAAQQHRDPSGRVAAWARTFVLSRPPDTLSLLRDLNSGIHGLIKYQSREDEGTQAPAETLRSGRGACRDMALLFVEAVRTLGFGARIVSGYTSDPGMQGNQAASESTHAWAEVFAPGAGWIAFDPTNARVGGAGLIPVAVGRGVGQVMPISGNYFGPADAFLRMTIGVSVRPEASSQ